MAKKYDGPDEEFGVVLIDERWDNLDATEDRGEILRDLIEDVKQLNAEEAEAKARIKRVQSARGRLRKIASGKTGLALKTIDPVIEMALMDPEERTEAVKIMLQSVGLTYEVADEPMPDGVQLDMSQLWLTEAPLGADPDDGEPTINYSSQVPAVRPGRRSRGGRGRGAAGGHGPAALSFWRHPYEQIPRHPGARSGHAKRIRARLEGLSALCRQHPASQ